MFHSHITTIPCVWQGKVIQCPYNVIFADQRAASFARFRQQQGMQLRAEEKPEEEHLNIYISRVTI